MFKEISPMKLDSAQIKYLQLGVDEASLKQMERWHKYGSEELYRWNLWHPSDQSRIHMSEIKTHHNVAFNKAFPNPMEETPF